GRYAGRGRGGDSGNRRQALPLRGAMLYDAEAVVLGHYLATREGAPLIGQMVDTAIAGRPIAPILAAQPRGPKTFAELDADWRQWLAARAESATKR
ncbi:MAG: hypothetical protein KGO03_13440, partial [Gemmatimonadota bacterium]|nr:hypothetical protein [Gemmatimonadota bacterium]